MAGLRIFVSSTCYDLSVLRSQLRLFLTSLGHEPILSENHDVLYDPRLHTHTSCLEEIGGCDVVVLVIGRRFGGTAIPEAVATLDLETLATQSKSVEALKEPDKLSITQVEVFKAIEHGLPIMAFVEEAVLHDHLVYEKNKGKYLVGQIEFPSIQYQESARFIFEFINFLRLRLKDNSIFPFSKSRDIEEIICRQLSFLLQRLLREDKRRRLEQKRIDELTNRFEDLKTAILSTIKSKEVREVAKGVARYRRVVAFVNSIGIADLPQVVQQQRTLVNLMNDVGICDMASNTWDGSGSSYLLKADGTFFALYVDVEFLNREWNSFNLLEPDSRRVIVESLLETAPESDDVAYFDQQFKEYVEQLSSSTSSSISELSSSDVYSLFSTRYSWPSGVGYLPRTSLNRYLPLASEQKQKEDGRRNSLQEKEGSGPQVNKDEQTKQ